MLTFLLLLAALGLACWVLPAVIAAWPG